jgi:hypothetical protein
MSGLQDLLVDELRTSAALSKDYMTKINESKTKVKRKYFKGKLHKNNERNAKLIMTIQRLEGKEEENEHTSDEDERS